MVLTRSLRTDIPKGCKGALSWYSNNFLLDEPNQVRAGSKAIHSIQVGTEAFMDVIDFIDLCHSLQQSNISGSSNAAKQHEHQPAATN